MFTCRKFLPGQVKHTQFGSVETLRRNNRAARRSIESLTLMLSLSAVYSRHVTLLPLRLEASP